MLNIIVGICLLSLGIGGVLTNWWAIIDFITVVIPLVLVVLGVLSILSGLGSRKARQMTGAKRSG
ncbi:MAG: hypothetical protein JXR96_16070 [Deltaproteobacteria bacterium]|nr:hypothetical protein [Deltaproteobacteria bacterium]